MNEITLYGNLWRHPWIISGPMYSGWGGRLCKEQVQPGSFRQGRKNGKFLQLIQTNRRWRATGRFRTPEAGPARRATGRRSSSPPPPSSSPSTTRLAPPSFVPSSASLTGVRNTSSRRLSLWTTSVTTVSVKTIEMCAAHLTVMKTLCAKQPKRTKSVKAS